MITWDALSNVNNGILLGEALLEDLEEVVVAG